MHSPSGMRRRSVPCLGATALLAAGALSFTWFADPIAAMQAGAPREAVRHGVSHLGETVAILQDVLRGRKFVERG
jgi:hypothetical protein